MLFFRIWRQMQMVTFSAFTSLSDADVRLVWDTLCCNAQKDL